MKSLTQAHYEELLTAIAAMIPTREGVYRQSIKEAKRRRNALAALFAVQFVAVFALGLLLFSLV